MNQTQHEIESLKMQNAYRALKIIEDTLDINYEEEFAELDENDVLEDSFTEARMQLLEKIYEISLKHCQAWYQTDVSFEEWYDKYIRPYKVS